MKILSLNAGSATLKFALFDMSKGSTLPRGMVDRLGQDDATLSIEGEDATSVGHVKMPEAVRLALEHAGEVDAIGCRVVHGGALFDRATRIDPDVIDAIRKLAPLAPLHNAQDLEVIEAVRKLRPNHPIVAVFDTTFHRTLPAIARRYAVPTPLAEVRRFGFHGISYRYIAEQMEAARGTRKGRLILCHLGSGASICAVRDGQSIETSMGMTPLEGLVMGTRSGDIDPGAVLYLLRETGMTVDHVDRLLNHESGLLGLSGRSADVRELEEAGDSESEFALDAFAYRVAKYVGAYSVVLDGLDALVFSGGIGENSSEMRRRICCRLKSIGISEPRETSAIGTATCLSGSQSPSVWVVRTDEERQIANETLEAISDSMAEKTSIP